MDRHLVIAGHARSGSTLLYNMLRHTLVGFEMFDAELPAQRFIDKPGSYCTKRPKDIFDIANVVSRNAGRKQLDLIVTLRDPRSIITSRHSSVPGEYFIGADACYFVPPNGAPTLTDPGFLHAQKAIMEVNSSGLFPQGIFFLKYEDLVTEPQEVQRLLAEQMDLSFQGDFTEFHKAAVPQKLARALNGVRSVETGRLRAWAAPEHRARIVDQFTRFPVLHDLVTALGYEPNRSWFETLLEEHEQANQTIQVGAPPAFHSDEKSEPSHAPIPVLYEDDDLKVTKLKGDGSQCLITFVGVRHGSGGIDQQSEEFRHLASGGWGSQLFVFDKRRTWGNKIDPELLAKITAPYRRGRRVVSLGLSMGGFLAVQMSAALRAARCIALAPQFSVHPEIAPFDTRWTRYSDLISDWRQPSLKGCFAEDCAYDVIFPDIPVERAHAALFPRQENVRQFLVNVDDHNVAAALKERGLLYTLLKELLSDGGHIKLPTCCVQQGEVLRIGF